MDFENTKIITKDGITFNQEYRIDKEGNVWTPYRGWKKMSHSITNKGYHRVGLMIGKQRKFFQVHRLVLEAFNPIKNSDKLQVNHIDGNKDNNKLENLEWCDGSYNMKHSYDTKVHIPPYGTRAGGNILNEKQVLEICELIQSGTDSYAQIGKKYGVSKTAIYDIKRKKSWAWLTKDYNFN